MAVVKTEQKICPGGPFPMKVNCNSAGHFTARLPSYYEETIGQSEVSGATLQDCIKAFDAATKLFKESKSETRKVIGCKVATRDDHWPLGIRIGVVAEVYEERKFEAQGKVTLSYKRCDSTLSSDLTAGAIRQGPQRGWRVIKWTPEREAFFCELAKRLERIREAIETLDKREGAERLIDGITPLVALMEATQ